jgi:hypothetical protein
MGGFFPGRRALTAIFAALACILVAAGCGGGSDSSGSISQAEFVKKGDAICTEGRKEIESGLAAYLKKNKVGKGKKESEAEAKGHEVVFIETIALPGLKKQVEEIKALGAPEGAETEAEKFLKAVETEIAKGEKNPGPLISTPEEAFEESDNIAQEIGFKVCGNRSTS